MRPVTGTHPLQRRDILGHCYDLATGQPLDHRVSLHVVGVRVATQNDLDIFELESELLHRVLEHRDAVLPVCVDQYVPLGGGDKKGGEAVGADVIQVADDPMWWKLGALVFPEPTFRRNISSCVNGVPPVYWAATIAAAVSITMARLTEPV